MKKGDIDYEKLYKDSIERAKGLKGKWIDEDGEEVAYFMRETLKWDYCDVYWVESRGHIANNFGAFLTKRACKEYLKKYGYNHSPKAHTYAMCAYRNFELDRLLKILKTMKLE